MLHITIGTDLRSIPIHELQGWLMANQRHGGDIAVQTVSAYLGAVESLGQSCISEAVVGSPLRFVGSNRNFR